MSERSRRLNISPSGEATREVFKDTISSDHELIRRLGSDEGQLVERIASNQPYLPLYIEPFTDSTLESIYGPGSITNAIFPEGYGTVVPRGIIDEKLGRLNSASEVPQDLNQYL